MAKKATKLATLEDLRPDPKNANEGTLRGSQLLDTSLEQFGAARPIAADKHGVVIAGNKTLETAVARGLKAEFVDTDGTELVVVQRTDLDLNDPKTRELAYLDNRTSEVGLAWNRGQLEADLASGVTLGGLFDQDELDALLGAQEAMEWKTTLDLTDPEFAVWEAFVRHLDATYPALPDAEKVGYVSGARLDAWVTAQLAKQAGAGA